MPELTDVHYALLAAALLAGIVSGWIFRGRRTLREKRSINAGWQAQIDSQQSEHDRLAAQNKSLMEQISQYQASNKDSKMRARELADSLKEAFARRDELQRQLKDIRGNLEVAITQRDRLKSSANTQSSRDEALQKQLAERDARIARLGKELANWQARVPPLVERYRQRDLEAQQLEVELQKANDQIAALQDMAGADNTRIEPVESGDLPDDMYASNEPHTETSVLSGTVLADDYEDAANSDDADDTRRNETGDDMWNGLDATGVADDSTSTEDSTDDGSQEPEVDAAFSADDPPAYDAAADADAPDDDGEDFEPHTDDTDDGFFRPAQDDNPHDDAEPAHAGPVDVEPGEPAPLPMASRGDRDDLKQIKGVGPAIEKTLHDLGIYRFEQIADMSEFDIDRVAEHLKGFRSRIYREDWIGQARSLQQQKHTSR